MPRATEDTTWVDYDRMVNATDSACLYDFGGEEIWIPRSKISDEDENDDGSGSIEIPSWLAEDRGLA